MSEDTCMPTVSPSQQHYAAIATKAPSQVCVVSALCTGLSVMARAPSGPLLLHIPARHPWSPW